MNFPMRINKYLAEQKIASRREADALISAKKVLVNGKEAVLGQMIDEDDKVTIKGKTKDLVYLAYYKEIGIITHSPSADEIDIAERLLKTYGLKDIHPQGRLDKNSEGLIILSNDGRLTAPLLDPENEKEKEYEVVVDKEIRDSFLNKMSKGVLIEGYKTKPARAVAKGGDLHTFFLTITEGKKHQVRRMCTALGYQVQNLKRLRVANIKLENLKPNQYRAIKGKEREVFLKSLGLE